MESKIITFIKNKLLDLQNNNSHKKNDKFYDTMRSKS